MLPNYTEFTALYDRYRINKVVLRYIRQFTAQVINFEINNGSFPTPGGAAGGRNPRMFLIKDYSDASNINSADEARQYNTMTMHQVIGSGMIKHIIRPAVQTEAYATAITSGYMPKWNQWIACDNPNVKHYGTKGWVDDCSTIATGTSNCVFKVEGTMYFSCANTR